MKGFVLSVRKQVIIIALAMFPFICMAQATQRVTRTHLFSVKSLDFSQMYFEPEQERYRCYVKRTGGYDFVLDIVDDLSCLCVTVENDCIKSAKMKYDRLNPRQCEKIGGFQVALGGSTINEYLAEYGLPSLYADWCIVSDNQGKEYLQMDGFERKPLGKSGFNGMDFEYTTKPEDTWFYCQKLFVGMDEVANMREWGHLAYQMAVEEGRELENVPCDTLRTWHHVASIDSAYNVILDGKSIKMDLRREVEARGKKNPYLYAELADNGTMVITILGSERHPLCQSWVIQDGKAKKMTVGYIYDFKHEKPVFNSDIYVYEYYSDGLNVIEEYHLLALTDKSGTHFFYTNVGVVYTARLSENQLIQKLYASYDPDEPLPDSFGEFVIIDDKCIGNSSADIAAWYDEERNEFVWIAREDDAVVRYTYSLD